jgi:RHS repeat-associated protein
MLLPNRHESSSDYRYGFQGQEMDDEIKGEGNSVNYKYRMHDPRIGRFFAVDPLAPEYPHYTPYSFSGNKVIHKVEYEGKEDVDFDYKQDPDYSKITSVAKANQVLNQYLGAYVQLYQQGYYKEAAHLEQRIYTHLNASPIKPTTTFTISGGSVSFGANGGTVSTGGMYIETKKGTGNYENGEKVKVISLDAGFSAGGGPTGAGGNAILDGEIETTEPTTSVTTTMEETTDTRNTTVGASLIGGYQYDYYTGLDQDGNATFTGSSHSYAAGIFINISTTSTILTTVVAPKVDTMQAAADNAIFGPPFSTEFQNQDSSLFKMLELRAPAIYNNLVNSNSDSSNGSTNNQTTNNEGN